MLSETPIVALCGPWQHRRWRSAPSRSREHAVQRPRKERHEYRCWATTVTIFEILPSLRHAATPRIDRAIWPLTARVDELGQLCVGEMPLTEIADEFGTPTYVIDEADFRHRIRRYRAALPEVRLVYAGKALLSTAVAQWVAEEGGGLGVYSGGELATALVAGVVPNQIVMHGNATTSGELRRAANVRVGRIVVDSPTQVALLATGVRQPQAVQVRITPNMALIDGNAAGTVERILDQPLLYLVGLHCDIGSQVTDASLYGEVIRQMVPLMADVRARHGVLLTELNIGGGHGVPYVSGDAELDLDALRDFIDDALDASCAVQRFPRPTIVYRAGPRDRRARRRHALSGSVGAVTTRRAHLRGGGRRFDRHERRPVLRTTISEALNVSIQRKPQNPTYSARNMVSISRPFFRENLQRKWMISLSSRSIAVSVLWFKCAPKGVYWKMHGFPLES